MGHSDMKHAAQNKERPRSQGWLIAKCIWSAFPLPEITVAVWTIILQCSWNLSRSQNVPYQVDSGMSQSSTRVLCKYQDSLQTIYTCTYRMLMMQVVAGSELVLCCFGEKSRPAK